jgi:hypothetical protein
VNPNLVPPRTYTPVERCPNFPALRPEPAPARPRRLRRRFALAALLALPLLGACAPVAWTGNHPEPGFCHGGCPEAPAPTKATAPPLPTDVGGGCCDPRIAP